MYLSTETHEIETGSGLRAESHPLRAGLRVAPSGDEPTGMFVVIEMAVLVLVAALAMASIIVSSNDVGYSGRIDRGATQATERRPARDNDMRSFGSRTPARTEQRPAGVGTDAR